MKNEIFASMKAQMTPSAQAKAALTARLAGETAPVRTVPWGRYVAVAACAALALAVIPVYHALKPAPAAPKLHSYVTAESDRTGTFTDAAKENQLTLDPGVATGGEDAEVADGGEQTGEGEHDIIMSADELTMAMRDAGFTREDIDSYLTAGCRMTWATWWKFTGLAKEGETLDLDRLFAFTEENREWIDKIYEDYGAPEGYGIGEAGASVSQGTSGEEIVEYFGYRSHQAGVNTGDLPDDCYAEEPVLDLSRQAAAVEAYQKLMDWFQTDFGSDEGPDWYCGSYINEYDVLVVVLTGEAGADKTIPLEVYAHIGSDAVGFGDGKYSLSHLRELQRQVEALPELEGMAWGLGVDEAANRLELEVPAVDDALLAALAALDPDDDAIQVRVAVLAVDEAWDVAQAAWTPASPPEGN